jgi:undecaprenyl-diphosphatase
LTVLQAFILGIVQGFTEFLPVSSSGHLVLVPEFFNIPAPALGFDILLHLATMVAVFGYFIQDIAKMAVALVAPRRMERGKARFWRRLLLWLVIGSVPAGVAGVVFAKFFEGLFTSTMSVGIFLMITGCLLWGADVVLRTRGPDLAGDGVRSVAVGGGVRRVEPADAALRASGLEGGLEGVATARVVAARVPISGALEGEPAVASTSGWRLRRLGSMGAVDALIIGCFEALAIAPGLSRSGATISAGVYLGFDRQTAARFSFLLSIPAILGAALVHVNDIGGAFTGATGGAYAVGAAAALVSGLIAVFFMMRYLREHRLRLFAVYTLLLGAFVVVLSAV